MNQLELQKVRRVRPKPRLAEVIRVQRLTPHMVRVVLGGQDLPGGNEYASTLIAYRAALIQLATPIVGCQHDRRVRRRL